MTHLLIPIASKIFSQADRQFTQFYSNWKKSIRSPSQKPFASTIIDWYGFENPAWRLDRQAISTAAVASSLLRIVSVRCLYCIPHMRFLQSDRRPLVQVFPCKGSSRLSTRRLVLRWAGFTSNSKYSLFLLYSRMEAGHGRGSDDDRTAHNLFMQW